MKAWLTSADSIAIDTLAFQCPELGGVAAYKLAKLRASFFDSYNTTVHQCDLSPGIQGVSSHGVNQLRKLK